jgi:hypothetical protein
MRFYFSLIWDAISHNWIAGMVPQHIQSCELLGTTNQQKNDSLLATRSYESLTRAERM